MLPSGHGRPHEAFHLHPGSGLDAGIAAAAADAGLSYSAWLAGTARKEFTLRAGLAAASQSGREHGPFTAAETGDADARAARAAGRSGQAPASAARRSA